MAPPAIFAQGQAGAAALVPTDVTLGQHLQAPATVIVNRPAPGSELNITLTSSDPSRLLLSKTPGRAGSASIVVALSSSFRETPAFYLQGLGKSGTVTYTASAPGFGSGTGKVTLAPSGFVIAGPSGIGSPVFAPFAATSTINVFPAQLDSSLKFAAMQALAGGLSVQVNVTSSNPAVGTVSPSTLTLTGGPSSGATTQFQQLSGGKTVLAVSTPEGFSTPAQDTAVTADILTQTFSVACNGTAIGQNLQTGCTVNLGQAAATKLPVTVTSGDPSQMLVSASDTAAGAGSITVNIPAGATSTSFDLQALGKSGAATYAISAPGFAGKTGKMTLAPSGVVIAGPLGLRGAAPLVNASLTGGAAPVTVYTAVLNSDNSFLEIQAVRGGIPPLQVVLKSSNPGVATIASPVTIPSGSAVVVAQFTPVSQGPAAVTVITPAGFVGSSNRTSLIGKVVP